MTEKEFQLKLATREIELEEYISNKTEVIRGIKSVEEKELSIILEYKSGDERAKNTLISYWADNKEEYLDSYEPQSIIDSRRKKYK